MLKQQGVSAWLPCWVCTHTHTNTLCKLQSWGRGVCSMRPLLASTALKGTSFMYQPENGDMRAHSERPVSAFCGLKPLEMPGGPQAILLGAGARQQLRLQRWWRVKRRQMFAASMWLPLEEHAVCAYKYTQTPILCMTYRTNPFSLFEAVLKVWGFKEKTSQFTFLTVCPLIKGQSLHGPLAELKGKILGCFLKWDWLSGHTCSPQVQDVYFSLKRWEVCGILGLLRFFFPPRETNLLESGAAAMKNISGAFLWLFSYFQLSSCYLLEKNHQFHH